MKRKRFIKLVMSYGVQRNKAEQLAKTVCVLGSYESVFAHYSFYLEGVRATRGIRQVWASLMRAISPVAEKIKECLNNIDWAGLLAAEDEGGEDRREETIDADR